MKEMLKRIILASLFLAIIGLAVADTVQLGVMSGDTGLLPIRGLDNYSYSQQIYTQAQINTAGQINKIRFYYVSGNATNSHDWKIYMGHSSRSNFANTRDWENPANLGLVFSGDIRPFLPDTNNWLELTLDTPFDYNNVDNLVLAVKEDSPGSNTMNWGTFNSAAATGMYTVNSSSPIDLNNIPVGKNPRSAINVIQFEFPSTGAPLAPVLTEPANGSWVIDSGLLKWALSSGGGDADAYDLYFGTELDPPLYAQDISQTNYTVELAAGNTYYWYVIAKNAMGSSDASDTFSFRTPAADMVVNSFEEAAFPPVGWTNPGNWSQSSGFSQHGAYSAIKFGSSSEQFILALPLLDLDADSSLDFWSLSPSTAANLEIVYSSDRENWIQFGEALSHPEGYIWQHRVVDLSALAGNSYYLGFRTGFQAVQFYVDRVIGPRMAPLAPAAPILLSPADNSENLKPSPQFSWEAVNTDGLADSFRLYCDTTNPPQTLIAETNATNYQYHSALEYGSSYYWQVSAVNAAGEGARSELRSFSIMADPTITSFPWAEDFDGSGFPPQNWERCQGLYPLENPVSFDGGWNNGNFAYTGSSAASLDIYGNNVKSWLISPPLQLPDANFTLKFDLALCAAGSSAAVQPGNQADDRFIVLLASNPEMTDASVLRQWDNAGSGFVYDEISHWGQNISIDLGNQAGIRYLAFYGESTQVGGNSTIYVDNLSIDESEIEAVLQLSETEWDFGTKNVNESGTKQFTITNAGASNLQIDGITIDGEYFALLEAFAPQNLAAGMSAFFSVVYHPESAGDHSALLTVISPVGNQTIALNGTAIQELPGTSVENPYPVTLPLQAFTGNTALYGSNYQSSWISPTSNYLNGDEMVLSFVLETDSKLSGTLSGGSTKYTGMFVVNRAPNPSNPAPVLASAYSGSGYSSSFTDVVLPAGTYYLLISSWPNPQNYQFSLDLSAVAVPTTPIFSINPPAFEYQTLAINAVQIQNFSITNIGVGSLQIAAGDITITGDDAEDFILQNLANDIVLTENQSATIRVDFRPQSAGAKTAYLQIIDNTSAKETHLIPLSGIAVDYTIRELPFHEGFENGNTHNAAVAGWSQEMVQGAAQWLAINSATYDYQQPRTGDWNLSLGTWSERWIFRPMQLTGGRQHHIELYARQDQNTGVGLGVYYGHLAQSAAMIHTIIHNSSIYTGEYQKLEGYFTPEQSGTYYLGINASTGIYNLGLVIDDITLDYVYDYPAGDTVDYGTGENAINITITGGSANNHQLLPEEWPSFNNGLYLPAVQLALELFGAGPWQIVIDTTAPWGAYYQNGNWIAVENLTGTQIVFDINAAKGGLIIPITLGGSDPTLPVTLSSFTAVLQQNSYVKVNWTAESETNHAGYNLYRSEVDQLSTALKLNFSLIETGDSMGSQTAYQYLDREVETNANYYYWLESLSLNGEADHFGPLFVSIKAADETQEIPVFPLETKLHSAFPNPFNPATNLRYSMSEAGEALIQVYNLKGQLMQSFQQTHAAPGYYQVSWNGRDLSGRPVSSGVYFYRMSSGDYTATKKMIMSK